MTVKEADRFWEYSLPVYGRARDAFLRLQDRDGADVPMLLWCLWCGSEGRIVPRGTMAEAVAFSEGWQRGVVTPLRTLRRQMKSGAENVPLPLFEGARALVATAEQDTERQQMAHLASLSPEPGEADPTAAAPANLASYAETAGLSLSTVDRATVLFAMRTRRQETPS